MKFMQLVVILLMITGCSGPTDNHSRDDQRQLEQLLNESDFMDFRREEKRYARHAGFR